MHEDSWREVPDDEWMPAARAMGIPTGLDSWGASSAQWFLERVRVEAERLGEPFTESELRFLSRHIMSNEPSQAFLRHINDKVARVARSALRRMLAEGSPAKRIGVFGPRWPTKWLDHHQILINSNHPMTISGPLQNAMAEGMKPWRP